MPSLPVDLLLLTPEFATYCFGGIGTYVNHLASALLGRGLRVAVFVPIPSDDAKVEATELGGGSWLFTVPVDDLPYRSEKASAQFAGRATAEARRRGVTAPCVHAHEYPCWPAALALRESLGARLVITFHQMESHRRQSLQLGQAPLPAHSPRKLEALEREVLRAADHVVCISEHVRREVQRLGPAGIDRRATRVYFPLELPATLPAADRRQRRARFAAPDEALVVFAGRAHPQKGAAPLLRSVDRLLGQRTDFRLLLVGGLELAAQMESQLRVETYGRVAFLPFCERDRLLELFQIADVGVVPSLFEPYGIVALEMVASGLPLVYADVDGLRELSRVAAGLGHPTYPVRPLRKPGAAPALDERALARQIDAALSQRKHARGRLGASRRGLQRAFSAEGFAEAHARIYAGASDQDAEASRSKRSR